MSEPVKIWCRQCHAKYDVSDFPPYTELECPECGAILRTPERFGRYLLEKVCGTGGTAQIYRALDPILARRVAVKIRTLVNPETGEYEEFYLREAKLFSPVNHPAIVPVYDCGIIDEKEFLVMQFMDGGNLEFHMKNRSLPEFRKLMTIFAAVSGGLHFIHERFKLIHHDVKPSNILLDMSGLAKLADFDLADVRMDDDLQTPCAEWGSPGYISPERLLSGGEDFRGDIFSLGVTCYELLSGHMPFGIAGEPQDLLERRKQPPLLLSKLIPAIDPGLAGLINAMLSYAPENRPGYQEIIREFTARS